MTLIGNIPVCDDFIAKWNGLILSTEMTYSEERQQKTVHFRLGTNDSILDYYFIFNYADAKQRNLYD